MKCPICKIRELNFRDTRDGRQTAHCPKCNKGRAIFKQDKPKAEPRVVSAKKVEEEK